MAPATAKIRMYNVGFGDCFLITLPQNDRPRRILFDCGSIGMDGRNVDDLVQEIVKTVTDDDGVPRIDLVVATHRHRDHVSGFANKAWASVAVGEVWMPWTEDPQDSRARDIRETQSQLALALSLSFRASFATGRPSPSAKRLVDVVGNALTNDPAMATLHRGFGSNPTRRYLPTPNTGTHPIELDSLPGVKIFVLGPSRDPQVIRDMDPPGGSSYLQLMGSLGGIGNLPPQPFARTWICHTPPIRLSAGDRRMIERGGDGLEGAVALALDKAVNGTSLMLMLQIGKALLLFPGDAQWGTWSTAMNNPEWSELLKRTCFYKIGHHGSHNATPKEFVEKMIPKDIWAMVSTKPRSNWPGIPKEALLAALGKRTKKIARSDKGAVSPEFRVVGKDYIETSISLQ